MVVDETTPKLPEQVILLSIESTLFALDLKTINEIILPDVKISHLPISPAYINGLILARDHTYPLVQLGSRIDLSEESRILLLNSEERYLAFLVERLHDLLVCTPDLIEENRSMKQEDRTLDESYFTFSLKTPHGSAKLIEFDQLYSLLIDQVNVLDRSESV